MLGILADKKSEEVNFRNVLLSTWKRP